MVENLVSFPVLSYFYKIPYLKNKICNFWAWQIWVWIMVLPLIRFFTSWKLISLKLERNVSNIYWGFMVCYSLYLCYPIWLSKQIHILNAYWTEHENYLIICPNINMQRGWTLNLIIFLPNKYHFIYAMLFWEPQFPCM